MDRVIEIEIVSLTHVEECKFRCVRIAREVRRYSFVGRDGIRIPSTLHKPMSLEFTLDESKVGNECRLGRYVARQICQEIGLPGSLIRIRQEQQSHLCHRRRGRVGQVDLETK